jgi:hypothetical protein
MFPDMGDLKPSLLNALVVFAIVLITVPLAKWALNAFPVPGLTAMVNAI